MINIFNIEEVDTWKDPPWEAKAVSLYLYPNGVTLALTDLEVMESDDTKFIKFKIEQIPDMQISMTGGKIFVYSTTGASKTIELETIRNNVAVIREESNWVEAPSISTGFQGILLSGLTQTFMDLVPNVSGTIVGPISGNYATWDWSTVSSWSRGTTSGSGALRELLPSEGSVIDPIIYYTDNNGGEGV